MVIKAAATATATATATVTATQTSMLIQQTLYYHHIFQVSVAERFGRTQGVKDKVFATQICLYTIANTH